MAKKNSKKESTVKNISDEELMKNAELLGKRIALYVDMLPYPESIKRGLFTLMQDMSPAQLVKLHDSLEDAYISKVAELYKPYYFADMEREAEKSAQQKQRIFEKATKQLNKLIEQVNQKTLIHNAS